MLNEDYPSIIYPVESRGHHCAYVQIDGQLEQNILEGVERFKPDVLALSIVQYTNGIQIDLGFLKRLKLTYPDLMIVADGTQFCGTAAFDFEASGIDLMIASGYKWMLGGYGNGFALLKDEAAEKLYTDEKRCAPPLEGFFRGRSTLSLYFEPGHLDTLNFGTLFNSVSCLQEIGTDEIETKIELLARKANQAFADRNLLSKAVINRKNHSSIYNINLPVEMRGELLEHGIITSSRGAGVRVSFHFYNSESDLEKLLEVIDSNRR